MGLENELNKVDLSTEQQRLFEQLLQEEGLLFADEIIASRANPHDRPLSLAQEWICAAEAHTAGTAFYHTVELLRLTGPLHVAFLEQALNEVVRRHEILRTNFMALHDHPVQIVASAVALVVPMVDFYHFPSEEKEAHALQVAHEETRRPFDLARDPLLRTLLIRLGEEEHLSVMTAHQVVFDGWSWGILMEEVVSLYNASCQGRFSPLPGLRMQYTDFAYWQRNKVPGPEEDDSLAYWKERLAGSSLTTVLPTDKPRLSSQTLSGDRSPFILSKSLTRELNLFAQQEGLTQFITLLAAFNALLYRYTGQNDIVVGFPAWGRNRTELEGLIGYFVNTLMLRTTIAKKPRLRELAHAVREVVLGAMAHQDVPFEKVVEALLFQQGVARKDVLQVMIHAVMVNSTSVETLTNVKVENIVSNTKTASCELELYVLEKHEQIQGYFGYNTDLFALKTIKQMARHYQTILEAMVADPDQLLDAVILSTETD